MNTIDNFVVGIGASAGGLDAIQEMFDHMDPKANMSFIIVQHLSFNFKSLMDELLAKHTTMPIQTVESGMLIKPNHIYLNPKGKT